ncbi:MAG: hypothetical protein DRI46_08140 [Chloroflexi bacterium]|nr:MAG: hypothetical protein DRI46_08140 [Chloroflexota bacterium]
MGWPIKSNAEIVSYKIDWSATLELDNDTISMSTWDVPPDLLLENQSFTDTQVEIWLGAGVDGKIYTITNTINTMKGLLFEAKFKLNIRDRMCVTI